MQPTPINPSPTGPLAGSGGTQPAEGGSAAEDFKKVFKAHLREVNALQEEADVAVRDLVTGQTDNIHEVIVAVTEADLSFRLMMQMRNKLLEAYQEIMRMQI
jgi:flagellar hook-basal body complex protein FliE